MPWASVSSPAVSVTSVGPRLPIRLRFVLAFVVGVAAIAWALPRARAGWRMHSVATELANYGLCMAGPTGAVALRDDPRSFRRLVRRRLVAAAPTDRPFSACSKIAAKLMDAATARIHERTASDFYEWGGDRPRVALVQLGNPETQLTELHHLSWPFVKGPISAMVRPSLGAREAVHPAELSRPGLIHGLDLDFGLYRASRDFTRGWLVVLSGTGKVRAFRSPDRGRSWAVTSPWQDALDGFDQCCRNGEDSPRFTVEHVHGRGSARVVGKARGTSWEAPLGATPGVVEALACDPSSVVAVTRARDRSNFHIYSCSFGGNCRETTPPEIGNFGVEAAVDIARVGGATVVAVTNRSLVRVTSTRDEGRSWSPLSIVLDPSDLGLGTNGELKVRLLSIDRALLLVAADTSGTSLGLRSDDLGASWRAP